MQDHMMAHTIEKRPSNLTENQRVIASESQIMEGPRQQQVRQRNEGLPGMNMAPRNHQVNAEEEERKGVRNEEGDEENLERELNIGLMSPMRQRIQDQRDQIRISQAGAQRSEVISDISNRVRSEIASLNALRSRIEQLRDTTVLNALIYNKGTCSKKS